MRRNNNEVSAELRHALKDYNPTQDIFQPIKTWTDMPKYMVENVNYKSALEKIRDYDAKYISVGILQAIAREALK